MTERESNGCGAGLRIFWDGLRFGHEHGLCRSKVARRDRAYIGRLPLLVHGILVLGIAIDIGALDSHIINTPLILSLRFSTTFSTWHCLQVILIVPCKN
ncbi:hypothetical protein QBC44DRAFT_67191 [Cladorrhinum sp. PSN332]|nr:hypothetical protein QBC44DRAFT_67191 [Cladorrhinum sp. PSN332]